MSVPFLKLIIGAVSGSSMKQLSGCWGSLPPRHISLPLGAKFSSYAGESVRNAHHDEDLTRKESMLSFYRRKLSLPSISLLSAEGMGLLDAAIAAGTASGFLPIVTNLVTQPKLTYCGLSSLATILNALCIDPQRVWKGRWRWYDETMFVNHEALLRQVDEQGLSFQDIVDLVPKDKVNLEAFFASESSLSEFRKQLLESCSSVSQYVLVGYLRSVLGQTGEGHYSPVGAYNTASDAVLIMDVARYKYPPHWVPCSTLWEAMCVINKVTKKSRGFMIISRPLRD